jgi:hypothetical protein
MSRRKTKIKNSTDSATRNINEKVPKFRVGGVPFGRRVD